MENSENLIKTNKYNMTVEQNIFVAKRNIIDYIWKSANLEGIAVTYPDTETIYNGFSVSGMKVDDILAINNLKHAWQFVLETIDYPIDYPFICKINQYVGGGNLIYNAGFIRKLPVSIGGTNWKPDMPDESLIKEDIEKIQKIDNPTDKALTLMLYLAYARMFLDGNKRTSMLAGNHVMISNGAGIISIPIELQSSFTSLLIKYYESNNMAEIKKFVYDNCIDGISF
ncbi:MAG: Fic family protein [Oscillospiraceae bacterium]|nr:Fic family protein [Oscillospiraceae bacterium]